MGTHPIFESDFDCLTDNSQWDVSSEPAEKAPVAFSRPEPVHARDPPNTAQWTLLNDMVSSRALSRISFMTLVVVLHF